MTNNDLDWVFTYHESDTVKDDKYEGLRIDAKSFAESIIDNCPPCADRSAALRKVREALMTANAAVALDGRV